MDELDMKLLKSLNANARKSFRDIAKELEVSLTTVSNRVKKLEEAGVIKGYAPLINFEKIGYDLLAVISMRISHGKLLAVQRKIAKNPHVYEIYDVTGDWDSILIARFKNRYELNAFVKEVVATEYVERTNTHMVLNVVKDEKRAQI